MKRDTGVNFGCGPSNSDSRCFGIRAEMIRPIELLHPRPLVNVYTNPYVMVVLEKGGVTFRDGSVLFSSYIALDGRWGAFGQATPSCGIGCEVRTRAIRPKRGLG